MENVRDHLTKLHWQEKLCCRAEQKLEKCEMHILNVHKLQGANDENDCFKPVCPVIHSKEIRQKPAIFCLHGFD